MASHNHHFSTSQPPSASALNYGLFDLIDPDFNFDAANSLPPPPPVKNISPNGPRGDGLQSNELQTLIVLLERMTESLEALKSAQDGRLPKDKLQDDALAKLTKGNSHLHRQLVNVQTTCESASSKMDVMIEHMVDLSTRTEKNAKQAEDSRVKLLVQDVVSQLVPQIVHQVVNRAGQQYHPQS